MSKNKGYAYGMSAQVAAKIAGKRDSKQEEEVQLWMEAVSGNKFNPKLSYEDNLHNGVLLCKLANTLKKGSIKHISESTMPFKQMETIGMFLTFAEKYGVPKGDLFQTCDLYDGSNISQVTATMYALGRVCHSKPEWDENSQEYKTWPGLGPKPSTENVRTFDEKTLIEGKKVIGIQAGTNQLASQSGQSFGAPRQIAK